MPTGASLHLARPLRLRDGGTRLQALGQRKVAERGYYPGNKAPYGYKLKKVREEDGNAFHNIFVKDPDTAPIVRRIFGEAIAGRPARCQAAGGAAAAAGRSYHRRGEQRQSHAGNPNGRFGAD